MAPRTTRRSDIIPQQLDPDLLKQLGAFYEASVAAVGDSTLGAYLDRAGGISSVGGNISADVAFKSDAPLLTSTQANYLNYVYGFDVTTYVYRELNFKALIPNIVWPQYSGHRVYTADQATLIQGVAENGSIPDAQAATDLTKASTVPAFLMAPWIISDLYSFRAEHDGDSIKQAEDYYRKLYAEQFALGLEKSYVRDAAAPALGSTANVTDPKTQDGTGSATTASTSAFGGYLEGVDRIIANKDLANNRSNGHTGWYDLQQGAIDRDGTTDHDAYVDHNSGTNRIFNLKMLDDLQVSVENAGAKWENGFLLTTRDTLNVIKREYFSLHRMNLEDAKTTVTVNGVSTYTGHGPMHRVASYDGCPIFPDKNLPKDGIGRIYYVYPEDLEILSGLPPTYLKADDKLLLGALRTKYAYLAVEQLRPRRFNRMGKIMDLKAAA